MKTKKDKELTLGDLYDDFQQLIIKYQGNLHNGQMCAVVLCEVVRLIYGIAPSNQAAEELLNDSIRRVKEIHLELTQDEEIEE